MTPRLRLNGLEVRGGEGDAEGAKEDLPICLHRLCHNREEGLGRGVDNAEDSKPSDGRG